MSVWIFAAGQLCGQKEVLVVHPLRRELAIAPKPRILLLLLARLLAAVLPPVDVGLGAEDAGAFLAAGDVVGHERPDVGADAVVDVGFPAKGLFG